MAKKKPVADAVNQEQNVPTRAQKVLQLVRLRERVKVLNEIIAVCGAGRAGAESLMAPLEVELSLGVPKVKQGKK